MDGFDTSPIDPRLIPKPVIPVANGAPAQPDTTPVAIPRVPMQQETQPAQPTGQGRQVPLAFPQVGIPGRSAAQEKLASTQEQGSGISRIHNPVLKTLATVGDVLAGTFAPRAEQLIPGTEGNYALHLARAGNAVKGEQEQEAARNEAALQRAQTHHAEAQANALENPQDATPTNAIELFLKDPVAFKAYQEAIAKAQATKEPQFVKDGAGNLVGLIDPQGKMHSATDPNLDPEARAIMEAAKPKEPTVQEGERPLGERVPQLNQALTSRYQVLHPKTPLPTQYQIPANATQKDYDRIDKALEAEERAIGTREQQAQTNEMRRQTMALAAQNATNRQDTAVRSAAFKAYTPALDSAERFNVMTKNYEDAIKNHDQQAMLSLLANHIGMTMGLQKGARLTKDIIHEAEVSRPWLQGMKAQFDKDGYLSGVNLTPEQMRQMVNLGRERFSEDVTKAASESRYQGVTDQGPDRIPNKSTINHYVALANGDPTKAKQLAAADGWTVK